MYLDNFCILDILDSKTRLSAGVIYDDTSLNNAVYALQVGWSTPFWTAEAIRGDNAFNHEIFTSFFTGSKIEPAPPAGTARTCSNPDMAYSALY